MTKAGSLPLTLVSKKSVEDAVIQRIVETVREEADVRKRRYSKSSFATAYSGPHNQFKMGQSKLKRFIDVAIGDGRLQVDAGKDKLLRPRPLIAKARPTNGPIIVDE
jgi:hypothetical protein